MVPTTGAAGVTGCAGITTPDDDGEVHPSELVTVKVYVPVGMAETVVVIPDPVVVTAPGVRVTVQVPLEGKPLNSTLPVDNVQVGGVMAPNSGAAGVTGCGLITTLADPAEVHPAELVTV